MKKKLLPVGPYAKNKQSKQTRSRREHVPAFLHFTVNTHGYGRMVQRSPLDSMHIVQKTNKKSFTLALFALRTSSVCIVDDCVPR